MKILIMGALLFMHETHLVIALSLVLSILKGFDNFSDANISKGLPMQGSCSFAVRNVP